MPTPEESNSHGQQGLPEGDKLGVSRLLFPRMNSRFFIRLGIVIVVSYFFFGFVCVPVYVRGESMEPTYAKVGFNFCWRPAYWFSAPGRGDIAVIRYTGRKLYLKRIIGLPGDTVGFRDGTIILNGVDLVEPYVMKGCAWDLPERKVEDGRIYVVGDNRSMPIEHHEFGSVSISRLHGKPLW